MSDSYDEFDMADMPPPAPLEAYEDYELPGPPRISRTPNKDGAKPLEPLPLIDLEALSTREPERRVFVLEKFIPQREVTLATGPGGAAKSLLGQQLCTCAAAGLDFLGLRTLHCPTLYVTAEDDQRELHWRQYHIAKRLGVPIDVPGLNIASIRGQLGNQLCKANENGALVPSDMFDRLAETIRATGAQFVVLDNAAHFFAGNENDRDQVTQFCNLLYRLGSQTGATIMLIAHPNKSGDKYSGSTAWLNAVRSHVFIDWQRDSGGEAEDPDARVMGIGEKANYARKDEKLEFRWHDFALVRDSDLGADWHAEMAAVSAANREDAIFMACLAAATNAKRAISHHPSNSYFATVFPGMPEAKKQTEAAFKRAFERLLANRRIELEAQLWRGANRNWKYGIRAVDNCTEPPHRTLHRPLAQNAPNASGLPSAPDCTERAPNTPPYINISAPLETAAPDISNDDDEVPF